MEIILTCLLHKWPGLLRILGMSPILSEIAAEKSKSLEDLIEEAEAFLRDEKPTQEEKNKANLPQLWGTRWVL